MPKFNPDPTLILILGWSPREFDATLQIRTMPVFEEAARQIVRQSIEHPEDVPMLAELLQDRVKALSVDVDRAKSYITTLISEQNYKYMDQIDK